MANDYISPAQDAVRDSLAEISATMAKIEKSLSATNQTIIGAYEKSHSNVNKKDSDASKQRNKEYEETAEKVNEKTKSTMQVVGDSVKHAVSSLLGTYESLMKEYTNSQQKLAYNLIGTEMGYNDVKQALSVLSTNAFVKQNQVYTNLTNLVSQGITLNVAQRAFLQTTASQVGLHFDTANSTFNRLIQLQREDLSESRLAQMAGLREFLEQNYQTSQYIQTGFSQVSDALFEMQSLMSSQMAMATEKTIQTYLGSFQSAGGGGNSVSSIAQALGAIGSGDFSGLSEGMQNLMVMAASRAGLSYADLLTGGLDPSKSERLMTSLFTYIAGMSNAGGGSNVAMNAIAKIFGVSVSDIRAAQQMNVTGINANNVNSDITKFLNDFMDSTNNGVRRANLISNLQSGAAMNTDYATYMLTKGISGLVGNILKESDVGIEFGAKVDLAGIAGSIMENMPLIAMLTKMRGQLPNGAGGVDQIFSNIGKVSTIKTLMTQGVGGLADAYISAILGGISGDLNNVYDRLAGFGGTGYSTRGSNYAGSGVTESFAASNEEGQQNRTTIKIENDEEQEYKTLDDLYNLLADDFPTTTWATVTNIASANNSVLLGDAHTTQYITDMITLTAVSTENILMLLENYFADANRTLIDMSALGLENS